MPEKEKATALLGLVITRVAVPDDCVLTILFNPFTPNSAAVKFLTEEKLILNFILQQQTVQYSSFHLNGHTLGFHPQT